MYEFQEGESVFHLTNDRFFESVVVLRVDEYMVYWEVFNDIANRHFEISDFIENFLPNTKEFVKVVNNINNERSNLESIDNRLNSRIYIAREKFQKRNTNPLKKTPSVAPRHIIMKELCAEKRHYALFKQEYNRYCVICKKIVNPEALEIMYISKDLPSVDYVCSEKCLKKYKTFKIL